MIYRPSCEVNLSLPNPYPRKKIHEREIKFSGYQRADGLWDIEGFLLDTKPNQFEMIGERTWNPNEPIHSMAIRITVDSNLVIQDIYASMDSAPHSDCPHALPPMKKFIGAKLGSGWRKTIDVNLGTTKGCTHLRELLFNIATATYQTIPGVFDEMYAETPPPHLDHCIAWRIDSDLVERTYPMFFKRSQT